MVYYRSTSGSFSPFLFAIQDIILVFFVFYEFFLSKEQLYLFSSNDKVIKCIVYGKQRNRKSKRETRPNLKSTFVYSERENKMKETKNETKKIYQMVAEKGITEKYPLTHTRARDWRNVCCWQIEFPWDTYIFIHVSVLEENPFLVSR